MCVCVCRTWFICAFSGDPSITTSREALMIYDNHFLSPKGSTRWNMIKRKERTTERERVVNWGCVTGWGLEANLPFRDMSTCMSQLHRTRTRQKGYHHYNRVIRFFCLRGENVAKWWHVMQTFVFHHLSHPLSYLLFNFIHLFTSFHISVEVKKKKYQCLCYNWCLYFVLQIFLPVKTKWSEHWLFCFCFIPS